MGAQLCDGSRCVIRPFCNRRGPSGRLELDSEYVLHAGLVARVKRTYDPDTPLTMLPLTTRAYNVLTAAGAKTVEDVQLTGLREIGRHRGCGKQTLKEIELMFFQEEKR